MFLGLVRVGLGLFGVRVGVDRVWVWVGVGVELKFGLVMLGSGWVGLKLLGWRFGGLGSAE